MMVEVILLIESDDARGDMLAVAATFVPLGYSHEFREDTVGVA
jgi:hypothetical protein